MDHYHDPADLKLFAELKKLAPAEFDGFMALDKIVAKEDSAIPRKYRELIAIAVACTTQCPVLPRRAHARCQARGRNPGRSGGGRVPCGGVARWSGGDARNAGVEVVRRGARAEAGLASGR